MSVDDASSPSPDELPTSAEDLELDESERPAPPPPPPAHSGEAASVVATSSSDFTAVIHT